MDDAENAGAGGALKRTRRTSHPPPTLLLLFGHVAPLVYEVLQVMSLRVVVRRGCLEADEKALLDAAELRRALFQLLCRGTSLIRKCHPVVPYTRTMLWDKWCP